MARNSQLLVELGQGLTLAIGLTSITSWDSTTRPKNAKRGTFGFNQQTSSLEYWDGSSWLETRMNEA